MGHVWHKVCFKIISIFSLSILAIIRILPEPGAKIVLIIFTDTMKTNFCNDMLENVIIVCYSIFLLIFFYTFQR